VGTGKRLSVQNRIEFCEHPAKLHRLHSTSPSSDLRNVVGAIFFYLQIATVPLLSAMVPLVTTRAVYYREVASGTYRRLRYGIAAQIAEIPYNMVAAFLSFIIFYYLVGLNPGSEQTAYFFVMALASYWILPAFGQLLAFVSPNIGTAVGYGSLLLTLCTLTMGFLLQPSNIPPWYIWLYWINPLRYILQGLVANQIGGHPEGDLLLESVGWSYDDRWWYCFVAVLLFGCALSAGILAAARISWLKR